MNIPSEWLQLYSAVNDAAPGAILAGGALRDLDNDRPVKDLDIFVNSTADFSFIEENIRKVVPTYRATKIIDASYMDAEMFDVSLIAEFNALSHIPVNVISVRDGVTPAEDTNRYDFGICQIWFDGTAISKTLGYHMDQIDKRFTLTRGDTHKGVKRSLRRYDRLKAKYDWPLIIPDQFKELV